jgi:hypothetical protein
MMIVSAVCICRLVPFFDRREKQRRDAVLARRPVSRSARFSWVSGVLQPAESGRGCRHFPFGSFFGRLSQRSPSCSRPTASPTCSPGPPPGSRRRRSTAASRSAPAPAPPPSSSTSSTSSFFQIGGVEAFGEPAVDGCEQITSFGSPALLMSSTTSSVISAGRCGCSHYWRRGTTPDQGKAGARSALHSRKC